MRKISILLIAFFITFAAYAQTGTVITCESINNIRHTCSADVHNGVVLSRQLSSNACIRGQSWGTTRKGNGVWVDKGCRGEFLIGALSSAGIGTRQTFLCESADGRRHACPADTSYGVQLTRQISKKSCNLGSDWGFDHNGIWVNHGCRAEFVVGSTPTIVTMTSSTRPTLVCESLKGGRTFCNADTSLGVSVLRQISDKACIRGENWNYDSQGIWVDRGCRAEFLLNSSR